MDWLSGGEVNEICRLCKSPLMLGVGSGERYHRGRTSNKDEHPARFSCEYFCKPIPLGDIINLDEVGGLQLSLFGS